jgi:hypothetical protein
MKLFELIFIICTTNYQNIQLVSKEVNSLQNHFHQHFFFIFFIANEKNVW